MRISPFLLVPFAVVGLFLAGGAARSQETRAVSRLITVYTGLPSGSKAVSRMATVYTGLPGGTQATSRLATVYSGLPSNSRALSRAITEYTSAEPLSTRADSRMVTAWLGYSVQNAATALRIAAGLHTASPREKEIFDFITAGTSASVVDILDACRVAIYAMNPSWLP